MSKSRLLQALESAPREARFTCPRTNIELTITLPTRRQRREAAAEANQAWGDRDPKTIYDVDELQSIQREPLLARVVMLDGEPIGMDTIDALDQQTLRAYDDALRALEDVADPPLETWSKEDIAALIEGIKKKDPETEERLRTFAVTTLRSLLRSMAAQLPNSETSTSSTS